MKHIKLFESFEKNISKEDFRKLKRITIYPRDIYDKRMTKQCAVDFLKRKLVGKITSFSSYHIVRNDEGQLRREIGRANNWWIDDVFLDDVFFEGKKMCTDIFIKGHGFHQDSKSCVSIPLYLVGDRFDNIEYVADERDLRHLDIDPFGEEDWD